jgi:hypothetical protein
MLSRERTDRQIQLAKRVLQKEQRGKEGISRLGYHISGFDSKKNKTCGHEELGDVGTYTCSAMRHGSF